MKKLFFLILFFSINILTFGANVYFLGGGQGYVYDGGTFYSNQDGHALVPYHLWADPYRYMIDEWGASFQDPDGNWSDWSHLSTSYGVHECLKAGTWHVQGRVHVVSDVYGYGNYWMYTSSALTFYVVDNYAPSAPQGLSVSSSATNHPLLTWSSNTEFDLQNYRVFKGISGNWQLLASPTGTSYEDLSESTQGNCPCHTVSYKVTAADINSNESNFSSTVNIQVEGASIEKSGSLQNSTINEYILKQNFPNPFNPSTNISYQIKEAGFVTLKVYDLLGRKVADLVNEVQENGQYSVMFNASELPTGVYIYSLRVNDFVQNQKMTLTK